MFRQVITVFCIVGICLLLEVNAKRSEKYGRSHSSFSSEKGHKNSKRVSKYSFDDDDNDSDSSHEYIKHRSSYHDDKLHSDEDYFPIKEIISTIAEDDEVLSGRKGKSKKGNGKLKYGADGAIHYFTKNGNHHHAHHHYFYEDSEEADEGNKYEDDSDQSSEHKETPSKHHSSPSRPSNYDSYPKEALKSAKKHKFTYEDGLLGSLHKEQLKNKYKGESSLLKDFNSANKNKYGIEGSHFSDGFVHITPTPYKASYKTSGHKDYFLGSSKPKIKYEDALFADKYKETVHGFPKQPSLDNLPIKESKKPFPDIYGHEIRENKKPSQDIFGNDFKQGGEYFSLPKGFSDIPSKHKLKYEDPWTSSHILPTPLPTIEHDPFTTYFKDSFQPSSKQKFNFEDALVSSKGLINSNIKSKPVSEDNKSTFEIPKSKYNVENSYYRKPTAKPKYNYDSSPPRLTTSKPKASFEGSYLDSTAKPIYDTDAVPSYKPNPNPKAKLQFGSLFPEQPTKPKYDYENYSSRPKYEYENTFPLETTTKIKFDYENSYQQHTTNKPKYDFENSYQKKIKSKPKKRPSTPKPKIKSYESFTSINFNEEEPFSSGKKQSHSTFSKTPVSYEEPQKHWNYDENEEDDEQLQQLKKKKCQRNKIKKHRRPKPNYNEEEEEKTYNEYPSYANDYKQEEPKNQEEEYKQPQDEKHIIYYNKEKRRNQANAKTKYGEIDVGSLRKYLNLERDQAFNRGQNKESTNPGQKATTFHYSSLNHNADYDFKNKRTVEKRVQFPDFEE